ncbi:anti-sigma factor [Rhizobium sp. S163]|uniref:anti-sigma factor n=1 Tax=Rhizobium sp. S163 TaxID=3055039 RepID=UPI0025A94498|nr:anti-sigma factor [Rhizobium sp. S163]MDM9646729.1 anti-sigma factor [Rhizobium sp. S163]
MRYEQTDISRIADEYVLGLLEPGDMAEVEEAMDRDANLRAAVAISRDRLLPLDMALEPAVVGQALWQRIESALPDHEKLDPPALRRPANENRPNIWRNTAVGALAATFVLAIGLAYSLMRTVEPVAVAVLVSETGEMRAIVEDFGNENAAVRVLSDLDVPNDKTIQVWTLPSREMGPISLGLLKGVRSARLSGPALPAPQPDQLYELTLEQAGGSPTGRPTGPILAKGLAKLPR